MSERYVVHLRIEKITVQDKLNRGMMEGAAKEKVVEEVTHIVQKAANLSAAISTIMSVLDIVQDQAVNEDE